MSSTLNIKIDSLKDITHFFKGRENGLVERCYWNIRVYM